MEIAQEHKKQLVRIQKNVRNFHQYWKDNIVRYQAFLKLVFKSSLTDSDISFLSLNGRPQVEFNILEPYISRMTGEFAASEPGVKVTTDFGEQIDPQVLKDIEAHLRHELQHGQKNGVQYNTFRDMLAGGFGALKVFTEYASEAGKSAFDQVIRIERVFDPTQCGWDPLAREPHKGDGRWSFELFPLTKEELKDRYGDKVDINSIDFNRSADSSFNWSYTNQKEEIVMLCDYYEKKRKDVKLVKLSNGNVVSKKKYEKFLELWDLEGRIEQPPQIVDERWTQEDVIHRYVFIEDQLIEHTETDYAYLPHVYFDGNSVEMRDAEQGPYHQMTRPLVYHAVGIQRLKNLAGISLAHELETLVQAKWMIAKEAIPQEQSYRDAITDIQKASTVVYNAFKTDDPNIAVPPPAAIQRTAIPPEISNTFTIADQLTQAILGNFDASINRLEGSDSMSGLAIQRAQIQSNSSVSPYIVNYMQSMSQVLTIFVDLMPKYYVTSRTIPIINDEGKREFVQINPNNDQSFNYDANALRVQVSPGVNFAVQKDMARVALEGAVRNEPGFGEFMATKGLEIWIDNLEVRNSDQLKILAGQYMQEKQQAQQEAQKNNPVMIKAQLEQQKLQLQAEKQQQDALMEKMDLILKALQIQVEAKKVEGQGAIEAIHAATAIEKAEAEKVRAEADIMIKAIDTRHSHAMQKIKMHHEVNKANREAQTTNG